MQNVVELGIPGIGPATLLARGGSAYVYLAEQMDFGRPVAVKVLFQALEDEATIKRFDRECRAIGAVSSHPNIVVVHGRGLTADDRPYLVMEHRAGGSLAERLAIRRRLTEAEATSIGIKIAGALDVAHAAGVLHRDVKPANILLSAYEEPALADFGIARIEGGHKTTQGVLSASVLHASREVLDHGEPTARSDVYSLASTLFELTTGRAPFSDPDDESMWAVVNRVLTEDAPDPTTLSVSPALAAVLRRGLSHDAAARQPSAAAFAAELEGLNKPTRANEPTAQTPVTSVEASSNTTVMASVPAVPDHANPAGQSIAGASQPPVVPTPRVRIRRVLLAVTLLIGVGIGAVIVFEILTSDASSQAASVDDVGTDLNEIAGADAADGPQLNFARAAIGPLRAGERYTLDVIDGPDQARYRILVDGQPVTDLEESVPIYFPETGRYAVQLEIETPDEERTTTEQAVTPPVEVYVSGDGPEPGYRANLASIRSLPENWPQALDLYDKLVSDGHTELKLNLSTRAEEDSLPFWNYYVDGFGDDQAEAEAYCKRFGLDADSCFVARAGA